MYFHHVIRLRGSLESKEIVPLVLTKRFNDWLVLHSFLKQIRIIGVIRMIMQSNLDMRGLKYCSIMQTEGTENQIQHHLILRMRENKFFKGDSINIITDFINFIINIQSHHGNPPRGFAQDFPMIAYTLPPDSN